MRSAPTFVRSFAFTSTTIALLVAGCGSSVQGAGSSAAVTSPLPSGKTERPTSKEGCDACGGLWDIHGIGDSETCICPTKDAGENCTDGQQCEGACVVTDDALQVTEQGDAPKGYYVGHCADYDTTFGCYRVVPNGVLERGPHVADEG